MWRQWRIEGLYVGRGTDEAYEVTFGKKWVPVERCKKLPLAKGGSLLWGEVAWIRASLGGVRRLEVLEQSLGLRQVIQLEWVIVGGKSGIFGFEARL